MIVRNLTLKVQGNRTCTDSPIYLYQNDRNIHLVITLNNVKYEVARDMYVSFTIVKPNGDVLDLTNGFLKDGKVHLILESELFDGDEEVGNALCQIKLYDNQRLSSISLPPFAIHVLKDNGNPIIDNDRDVLLSQDELKLLTENELALSVERKIKISELPTTTEASGYVPVAKGDTTYKLDMSTVATKEDVANVSVDLSAYATKEEVNAKADAEHTHDEYLTEHQDLSSYALRTEIPSVDGLASEDYVDTAIANLDVDVDLTGYATKDDLDGYALKTEIPSTDGLATKEYVDSAVSGRIEDGSNYATKSELASKADINHAHSQYLTEHQDISHLATKSEIPSLNGYATETYVNDAIANIDTGGSGNVDLSGYVTTETLTTELNKKSDTTHTHDNYVSSHLNNEPLYSSEEIQTLYLNANARYYYATEYEYFNGFRIQLPTSGFTYSRGYEFHIFYDATEFSYNTYKRNITVTGGTVKWQSGTSLEIDTQHIYEIILTYIPNTRKWLGGVVVYG